ncbi:unnamed protein product [Sphacelaria rigidula]
MPTTPPDSWGVPQGAIHSGFNNGVAMVWEDCECYGGRDTGDRGQGMVQTIREFSDGKRKLFVAGHSLGGALATVAAARLVFEENMKLHGMYTIGSPRVFDADLATGFNAKMNDGEYLRNKCFRVRNNNDIVPHVPPSFLLEYRHVGTDVYFDRHGMRCASSLLDAFLGYFEAAAYRGNFIDGIGDHSGKGYVKLLHNAMLKTRDAVVKPVEKMLQKNDQKASPPPCLKAFLHGPMDAAKNLKLRFRIGELDLPERRKIFTSRRKEEEVDAQNCPCGEAIESRSHLVAECELYKQERDVLEGKMRDANEDGMKPFDPLDSREKMMAVLGDRWWPQITKQDGDRICKRFSCTIWKKRNERLNIGGVSIRSRNGAPSQEGYVANDQTTKASNK